MILSGSDGRRFWSIGWSLTLNQMGAPPNQCGVGHRGPVPALTHTNQEIPEPECVSQRSSDGTKDDELPPEPGDVVLAAADLWHPLLASVDPEGSQKWRSGWQPTPYTRQATQRTGTCSSLSFLRRAARDASCWRLLCSSRCWRRTSISSSSSALCLKLTPHMNRRAQKHQTWAPLAVSAVSSTPESTRPHLPATGSTQWYF